MSQLKINQAITPVFARPTTAYSKDATTSVASGIVRYENTLNQPKIDTKAKWDRGTHLRTNGANNSLNLNSVPVFARNGAAYDQVGISYAQNVPRYGNTINILGATNILSAALSQGTSGWGVIGPVNPTTITNNDPGQAWEGTTSAKVVCSGSLNAQGTSTGTFAVSPLCTYTASVYVFAPLGATLNAFFEDGVNGTPNASINFTGTGAWQRVVATITGNSTTNTLLLAISTNGAQAITFWLDGAQVEQNAVATPWIIGGTNRPTTYLQDSIMVEEGTINTSLYSADFTNVFWVYSYAPVTTSTVFTPNGTYANKISDNIVNGQHAIYNLSVFTVGQPATVSVYAKAGDANFLLLSTGPTTSRTWFNLAAGTIGTTVGGLTNRMTYVGDGWYRCSISRTAQSGDIVQIQVASADNVSSYIGTGKGFYLWGAQTEVRSYPTSYVPTTSSVATRYTETLSIPAPGTLNLSQGTVIVRAYCNGQDNNSNYTGIFGHATNYNNGANAVIIDCSPIGVYRAYVGSAAANVSSIQYNTHLSTGYHTFGIRYGTSECSFWIDGVKVGFVLSPSLPQVYDSNIYIGSAPSEIPWDGSLGNVNIFNIPLTDADMLNYTQASGSIIPIRPETTFASSFAGNTNFSSSGVYVSEWFNSASSGAIWSSATPITTNSFAGAFTYDYRVTDDDALATYSTWTNSITNSAPSGLIGKYIQGRITLVTNNSIPVNTLPSVTSLAIIPADLSKSVFIEEATTNLFPTDLSAGFHELALNPALDHTLSIYPTAASSGSVVANHAYIEDFTTRAVNSSNVTVVGGNLTLSPLADPSFARSGNVQKKNGTFVGTGVPRYEEVVYPVQIATQLDFDAGTSSPNLITSPGNNICLGQMVDNFNVDSSLSYSQANVTGNSTWHYNFAQSRLEATMSGSGVHSVYSYNNFSARDAAIEAIISQAVSSALVLRYQDISNYYLLVIADNISAPVNNISLYRKINGVFTQIGSSVTTTFARTVFNTFRFEIIGNELKGYQNNSLIISGTDSSITIAGKVGLYSDGTTTTSFNSFTIDQLNPLFSRPSVANLMTTGAQIARNIPRYELGRNMVTYAQSVCENYIGAVDFVSGYTLTIPTTVTASTDYAWQGSKSLKVIAPGNVYGVEMGQQNYVRCKPNTTYTFSAYIYAVSGFTIACLIQDIAATVQSNNTFTIPSNVWTRVSVSITIGANASYTFGGVRSFGGSSGTFYTDGWQLESGSTPTTWNPGGPGAILIEEGTSNITSAGQDNFVTSWGPYSSSVASVNASQTDPFGGTGAYLITTTGGTDVFKYYGSFGAGTNGLYYSGQIWVKNNDASNLATVRSNQGGVNVTVANSEGWKLVKMPNILSNGFGQFQFQFATAAVGTNLNITVMNPMYEQKAYCTSYIPPATTRSPELNQIQPYNIQTPSSGTVIIRAYVDGDAALATASAYHLLFDMATYDYNNRINMYRGNDTTYVVSSIDNAGASSSAVWSGQNLTVGWHTFAVRWSIAGLSLWVDGVNKANNVTALKIPSVLPDVVRVGSNIGVVPIQQWNYSIDDVSIFPVVLSDTDMATFSSL